MSCIAAFEGTGTRKGKYCRILDVSRDLQSHWRTAHTRAACSPTPAVALDRPLFRQRAFDSPAAHVVLQTQLAAVHPSSMPMAARKAGFSVVHPVAHLGRATPFGHAFALAFEEMLYEQLVPNWTDDDVAELSNDFLIAFSLELTPRLDITYPPHQGPASRRRTCPAPRANRSADSAVFGIFQGA